MSSDATPGIGAKFETEPSSTPAVRLIAMGSAPLTQGFGLIGFETWPDAGIDDVEKLLGTLLRGRETAVVVLERDLARCDCATLRKVRAEGGRIVIAEVPPLCAPGEHDSPVEDLLRRVLGPDAVGEEE